jgi:asparagine synthase (glutamine-hydrolysing)
LQTKAVLRAAVADFIPAEILTRKKMGFPVPMNRWLREEFHPLVQEFILGPRARDRRLFQDGAVRRLAEEHRIGPGKHGDRLWLLINLEIWHRIFIDGEDPDRVMRPVGRAPGVSYAPRLGSDAQMATTSVPTVV